jgi:anti-sigma factor RsiW
MRCEEVRERLGGYTDGELGNGERGEVEEHLGGCDACAREAGALARLRDAVTAVVPEVAEEEWRRVGAAARARVAERPAPVARRARRRVRRWLEAAGVAAAVLLAVILYNGQEEEAVPMTSVQSLAAAPGWNVSVRLPQEPGRALVIWVTPGGGGTEGAGEEAGV